MLYTNTILTVLVVCCVIFFVWVYLTSKEYFEPDKTLKFHKVSKTERYSISPQKVYPELKAMTSAIEHPQGILLTSKKGEVVLQPSSGEHRVLMNLADVVADFTAEGEGGALCIVADPYDKTNLVISYTTKLGDEGQTLIIQKCYLLGGEGGLELGTVWFQQDFADSKIHHAGTLMYDPKGNMFLTIGDGGPQGDPENHAQNLQSYRGKLLNLGRSEADDVSIVAYGLRNPWRFDISEQGTFVADVGYNNVESLYLLPDLYPQQPYNCGWNQYEGSVKFTEEPSFGFKETLPPIFEYHDDTDNPSTPGRAIIGGFYLPKKEIYVFGDHMSKYIFVLQKQGDDWVQVSKGKIGDMTLSFGFVGGELYALTFGGVYRIDINLLR